MMYSVVLSATSVQSPKKISHLCVSAYSSKSLLWRASGSERGHDVGTARKLFALSVVSIGCLCLHRLGLQVRRGLRGLFTTVACFSYYLLCVLSFLVAIHAYCTREPAMCTHTVTHRNSATSLITNAYLHESSSLTQAIGASDKVLELSKYLTYSLRPLQARLNEALTFVSVRTCTLTYLLAFSPLGSPFS